MENLNNDDKKRSLELISYYIENFYNDFFIFTERVKKYLETIKNYTKNKEFKNELLELRKTYLNIFNGHRDIRNDHNHKKRYFDENYRKLVLIDLTHHLNFEDIDLPKWETQFNHMKENYLISMTSDITQLRNETNNILNIFNDKVFTNLIYVD